MQCRRCRGSGVIRYPPSLEHIQGREETCPACRGSGELPDVYHTAPLVVHQSSPYPGGHYPTHQPRPLTPAEMEERSRVLMYILIFFGVIGGLYLLFVGIILPVTIWLSQNIGAILIWALIIGATYLCFKKRETIQSLFNKLRSINETSRVSHKKKQRR